jgi:cytochrome c553
VSASSILLRAARVLSLSAVAVVSIAAANDEAAAAPAAGAKPALVGTCAACHGENGVSASPMFPNLAGQHRSYLEVALKEYKNGKRKNPVMAGTAAALSDADIKQLAAWYASQPSKLYTVSPEAAKK